MQCDVISMTFAYLTNLNISRMKQGDEILRKMLLCHFKCSFKCNHKKIGVKSRCIGTLKIDQSSSAVKLRLARFNRPNFFV